MVKQRIFTVQIAIALCILNNKNRWPMKHETNMKYTTPDYSTKKTNDEWAFAWDFSYVHAAIFPSAAALSIISISDRILFLAQFHVTHQHLHYKLWNLLWNKWISAVNRLQQTHSIRSALAWKCWTRKRKGRRSNESKNRKLQQNSGISIMHSRFITEL